MSVLNRSHFYDEKAAFAYVESILWPQGPVCPHCGAMERAYALKGVRTKANQTNPEGLERHGLYKCGECRKQYTVRKGTIFEESHCPLHKWLQAIHLICSSKKGISSHQLHRVLEVQYKTAWFLSHRIREAMRSGDLTPFGGGGSPVEVDETYFGMEPGKKRSRGVGHKMKVLSLVDRNTGRARSFVVDDTKVSTILPILQANISREAVLLTDEANIYTTMGKQFAQHEHVRHSIGEYAYGPIHTNTIEGYFSVFKRGMKGVYQHCSKKHLHRYMAEFDFRYTNRAGVGVDDTNRAVKALLGVVGKRLTYRGPDAACG
jgi:transposase-like protein